MPFNKNALSSKEYASKSSTHHFRMYSVYFVAQRRRQTTTIRTLRAVRKAEKEMHPPNTLKSKFNATSSIKASHR